MAWPADSLPCKGKDCFQPIKWRFSTFLPPLTLASTLSSFLPQMTEHGTAIWTTAFSRMLFCARDTGADWWWCRVASEDAESVVSKPLPLDDSVAASLIWYLSQLCFGDSVIARFVPEDLSPKLPAGWAFRPTLLRDCFASGLHSSFSHPGHGICAPT